MKTIKILILSLLVASTTVAQDNGFKYGTRFGLGESQVDLHQTSGESSRLAVNFGISTNYQFTNVLGANVDALIVHKGATKEGVTTDEFLGTQSEYEYTDRYTLLFAELPITGQIRLPLNDNLFIKGFAGPSMNFKLMGLKSREYENSNYNQDYGYYDRQIESMDVVHYSMVYGAGVDVKNASGRTYFLDFRSSTSMGTIGSINGDRFTSRYYTVNIGYLF